MIRFHKSRRFYSYIAIVRRVSYLKMNSQSISPLHFSCRFKNSVAEYSCIRAVMFVIPIVIVIASCYMWESLRTLASQPSPLHGVEGEKECEVIFFLATNIYTVLYAHYLMSLKRGCRCKNGYAFVVNILCITILNATFICCALQYDGVTVIVKGTFTGSLAFIGLLYVDQWIHCTMIHDMKLAKMAVEPEIIEIATF
ncbi:hypothetical protein FQA39_LY14444 [Lamprigera yunnana]|nr:hypothetical protein FQA39_LY14444 [Lamprigera yunnana]